MVMSGSIQSSVNHKSMCIHYLLTAGVAIITCTCSSVHVNKITKHGWNKCNALNKLDTESTEFIQFKNPRAIHSALT